MTESRAPARRRLQFSLRWLMLMMLVVAAYIAGWQSATRKAQLERQRMMERAQQAAEEARLAELKARQSMDLALQSLDATLQRLDDRTPLANHQDIHPAAPTTESPAAPVDTNDHP